MVLNKVGNLKVKNMTLIKENMYLKQKMKINDEARRRLELLANVAEI
jgi:hypothetical protein